MAIKDIFDTICCCQCGVCCSKNELCEQCLISTLMANGLKLNLIDEIRGLKPKSYNHSSDPFGFSELCYKLKELRKDKNNYQRENYP